MKKILLCALCVLCGANLASARIGQTREVIESIRGQPIKSEANAQTYQAGGYKITVVYQDGKSVQESYAKIDNSPLSGAEVNNWLVHNVGASRWGRGARVSQQFVNWMSEDHASLLAVYDLKNRVLVISSIDYAKKHSLRPPTRA